MKHFVLCLFCLLCLAIPSNAADIRGLESALAALGRPKAAAACPCSPTCGMCNAACNCGCADGAPCTCAGWAFRFRTYAEWRASASARRRRDVPVVFPPLALPFRTAPAASFAPMSFGPSPGACRGGG